MAHDARPWLGKIQVPTLIVGGERDYIVGNKAAYELAENISDCKLKIYEKYGAFEEAKDFNDLVLKFLVWKSEHNDNLYSFLTGIHTRPFLKVQ